MTDAAYYAMKAKECFKQALGASNRTEYQMWKQRGYEYAERASIAATGMRGNGLKRASNEHRPAVNRVV
jgi:hypothetical protein